MPIRPDPAMVLMCRRASDPLELGSERGHYCAECGLEVAVSATGRLQLDQGAIVVCWGCGPRLVTGMADEGKLVGVQVNPAAQRAFVKMDKDALAEEARDRLRREGPICDICNARADHFWVWTTRPFCSWLVPKYESEQYAEWAICPACRPLWEAQDARALASRAEEHVGSPGWAPRYQVLYEAAFLAIKSGPRLLEVTR